MCATQDEQLSSALDELRDAFLDHDFDAAGLSQEAADDAFDAGADGLRAFKETVSERQRTLPDVQQQVQAISQVVDQVQDQTKRIGAVEEALEDHEKLSDWVTEQPRFEDAWETVKRWEARLEGLPSTENIESITEFSPLDTEEFAFELLKNEEAITYGKICYLNGTTREA